MQKIPKFLNFLESISSVDNVLIDSVIEGFSIIFEASAEDLSLLKYLPNLPAPKVTKIDGGKSGYKIKFPFLDNKVLFILSRRVMEHIAKSYDISSVGYEYITKDINLYKKLTTKNSDGNATGFSDIKTEFANSVNDIVSSSKPIDNITDNKQNTEKDETTSNRRVIDKPTVGSPYMLHGTTVYPATYPFNPDAEIRNSRNSFLKSLKFRFDPDRKTWYTTDERLYNKIKNNFDDVINDVNGIKKTISDNIEKSSATDANIDIPTPKGLAYLPYQKAGIMRALESKNALIADEMGLGKTMQAIGVAQMTKPKNMLIIVPESVIRNWVREWNKWDTTNSAIGVLSTADAKTGRLPSTPIVITGFTAATSNPTLLTDKKWDILVIDEAHRLKNSASKRTKSIFGEEKWDSFNRQWTWIQKSIEADRTLMLTGTPIPNQLSEMWPMIRRLDREGLGKSKHAFLGTYANKRMNSFTGREEYYGINAEKSSELQQKLRGSIMIKRNKSDVLKELPAKQRKVVKLTADGNAQEIISEEDKLYSTMRNSLQDSRVKTAAFKDMSRTRHALGLTKVDKAIDYVKGLLSQKNDQKIVVFSHHVDIANDICDALSQYGANTITGNDSLASRDASVEAFQNDPTKRILSCTITAAGVGLTMTAADIAVFVELTWTPGELMQAEDRIHRVGQKNGVWIHYLVYDNSLDMRMFELVASKGNIASKALDKDEMDDYEEADDIVAGEEQTETKRTFEPSSIRKIEPSSIKKLESTKTTESGTKLTLDTKTGMYLPQLQDSEKATIINAATLLNNDNGDKASEINGIGYNKFDGDFGRNVAYNGDDMEDWQLWKALRMVIKYRKQLSPDLVNKLSAISERGKKEGQES